MNAAFKTDTFCTATIAAIGLVCKGFLKVGTKDTETHGLDNFVKLLDERQDISQRERGLLTVSNHTSVYVLLVRDVQLEFFLTSIVWTIL